MDIKPISKRRFLRQIELQEGYKNELATFWDIRMIFDTRTYVCVFGYLFFGYSCANYTVVIWICRSIFIQHHKQQAELRGYIFFVLLKIL